MRITINSEWNMEDLILLPKLAEEIDHIDKANKRKKKALRQMNKALKREKETKDFYRELWDMTSRKNADATRYIKELEQAVRDLERELDRIESVLTDDETD